MKKVFWFSLLFLMTTLVVKAGDYKYYPLEWEVTNTLSKEQNWEKTNEWIALNFSSYKASVDYKNEQSGKIIVKGIIKDMDGLMTSLMTHVLSASIEFTMVIQCQDSLCTIQFSNILCSFKSGYGNIDYLPTKILETCRDEMNITMIYGPNFTVDERLEKKYNEIESEYKTAESVAIDTTLKKNEQKKAKKIYEQMKPKYRVFYTAVVSTWSNIYTKIANPFEEMVK